MTTHRIGCGVFGIAMVIACVQAPVVLAAQEAAPPPASQPDKPASDEKSPPSLDDLLGVGDESKKADGAADAAAKESDDELKRRLNEADPADSFEEAITKMSLSADLLDAQFDPGLGTQRVQEDIIAKLAHLIDQAKKRKSQSQKSSSSSSNSSGKPRGDPSGGKNQKQGDRQNQNQDANNQRPQQASDSREGNPPEFQEGDINKVMEETRTEWGNLPPRFRDMLMQGRKEKFSSLYQQLTHEYYKRLAEENGP